MTTGGVTTGRARSARGTLSSMSSLWPGTPLATWRLERGPGNAITDVAGVTVGHTTVTDPDRGVATGVTVVVPEGVEQDPVPAASHVINGYGKSVGLVQVDELGVLESPIAFASVFAAPEVQAAMLRRRLAADPEVGGVHGARSVNLVVLECNDGFTNDPRRHSCGEVELDAALSAARGGVPAQGTVGAGTGMSTFGMAGGFGTASRVVATGGDSYRLGVALVSNYGRWGDLTIAGQLVQTGPPGPSGPSGRSGPSGSSGTVGQEPPGSVVIVVATDAPFDSATLRRVAVRAQNGLARTGCATTHGSGEIVLAFSTSRAPVTGHAPALLDLAFRAVAECVEDAVLSGLAHAEPVTGREGRRLPVLGELEPDRPQTRP